MAHCAPSVSGQLGRPCSKAPSQGTARGSMRLNPCPVPPTAGNFVSKQSPTNYSMASIGARAEAASLARWFARSPLCLAAPLLTHLPPFFFVVPSQLLFRTINRDLCLPNCNDDYIGEDCISMHLQ